MWRLLWWKQIVLFHKQANQLIYSLQKLPLIGKKVPESWYRMDGAKTAIGAVATVLGILFEFVKKFLYCIIFLAGPAIFIQSEIWGQEAPGNILAAIAPMCLWLYFVLSSLFGAVFNTTLFEAGEEDFILLRQLGVSPRNYLVGKILEANLRITVFMILPLSILVGPLKAILLLVIRFGLRFASEAFGAHRFDIGKRRDEKRWWVYLIPMLATAAIAYALPALLGPERFPLLSGALSVPVLAVLAALSAAVGVFSWRWLCRFKGYARLRQRFYTYERVMQIQTAMEEANKNQMDSYSSEDELTPAEQARVSLKHGYAYLHELFVIRHKKILLRSTKKKTIITAAASAGILIAMLFIPQERRDELWSTFVLRGGSVMFFMFYFMSGGALVCKAFFYHCDESMLRYGYFRRPEALRDCFRLRLKTLSLLSVLPAVPVIAGTFVLPFLTGHADEIHLAIPLALEALILPVFFSVFHLFCYYMFQPYTHDGQIKSPWFRFASMAIYIAAYVLLYSGIESLWMPVIVLGVTILFLAVALYCVMRFAPKTFRIK
ncbi:MAG: hypothetical protein IJL66_04385 [Lachnospiraceae bacterium]|nr:hypothetical protein [Lachnospiraceae bacterium]